MAQFVRQINDLASSATTNLFETFRDDSSNSPPTILLKLRNRSNQKSHFAGCRQVRK